MITEDQLEQLCLEWFDSIGYDYANGYDIAPEGEQSERNDYHQVLLLQRLVPQLESLNPHIPLDTLEQVAQQLSMPESPKLVTNNQQYFQYLQEGFKVEYKDADGQDQTDYVRLIDFDHWDKNTFLVVNQLTVKGKHRLRRPDIVVFVNGLPLVVIELKNPADEQADIWGALNQLQTYKNDISDLFLFNQALVISDGIDARIGSLTADAERFLPWRTRRNEKDKPQFEYQLETLVKGFFEPELFLEYIHHFILFETHGDQLIKKIAGYHQFHAVRAAVNATLIARRHEGEEVPLRQVAEQQASYLPTTQPGSGKVGVVWHTQGSGKSISMVCYAAKLLSLAEMNNPTLVVVTDRNDLDGQLYNTFVMAASSLKQQPVQADGRDALRAVLNARPAGGIIFTTIQKFALEQDETFHPVLNDRSNIVVISDEAHRSQYGDKAKLKREKDAAGNETSVYTFGYSKYLRDALPNASFIGFTGTPIASEDKNTRTVFGEYVSVYDIQDAVKDGATVPIYYEARLAKLDIHHQDIERLNDEVEEVIEDEDDTSVREKTKSKWASLEKLVGAEERITRMAGDLVQHFNQRNATMSGKAMIVCMSRDICVALYDAIVALKPEWHDEDPQHGAIKIVMTGSAADKQTLQPHIYSKPIKKAFEKRFKDVSDPLQLVIVRDMWLTGFDAPNCHTMYIDKPMKGHNLMQAIARVNRVFKDKPGGLVVDYIGIASELKKAIKTYTDSQGKGQPTVDANEAFSIVLEKLDAIEGLFATPVDGKTFDDSTYETAPLPLLPLAMDHIFGLDDGKQRYLDLVAALKRAYSLSRTLDAAKALHTKVAFLDAVKAVINKSSISMDARKQHADKDSAMKQIIDNAIVTEEVADVFRLVDLDKPDIGLLSEEFLEDVKNLPQKNLAVELLGKLLRDEVKARMATDVVSEKKYSDRILASLRKYHNRAIESAQVIEELVQMAKDMAKEAEEAERLGLNPDEIAFYRALAQNESAVRELGDNTLRELAKDVTEKLRKSTTVDWSKRESVRAKLRTLVRRALRRWKYPPDKSNEAIDLCLKQAEALSESWAV